MRPGLRSSVLLLRVAPHCPVKVDKDNETVILDKQFDKTSPDELAEQLDESSPRYHHPPPPPPLTPWSL